jgi:hypothetical protein
MGRILKVVLIHIAIAMLIGFILPSSERPLPSSSSHCWSTVWDSERNLIHPTYPPQDLQGRYLSLPRELRTSDQERANREGQLLQSTGVAVPQYK